MIKTITAAVLSGMAVSLSTAPVYNCQNSGQTVYTSEPNGHCRIDKLPGIGRYDGGGYTLTGKAAKKQPQKAGKSARQRPKKTADSKKKTTEKAAAQSKQRVKGNGYRGFPTMARKEVK